jgi:hypothetical protein
LLLACSSSLAETFAETLRLAAIAKELRRRFPADEIAVTPRGMANADVTQTVRLGGHDCGVIL